MYGFVYRTKNEINGMMYIGKCEYARKNGWENYLGSGTYLKDAVSKYGKDNFTREILAEATTKYELEALEESMIHYYNAVEDPNYYNLKQTSIGGDTFTNNPNKEHTRALKSLNSRGKNNPQYNATKSERMIKAVKTANSKQVVAEGILYPSLTEAGVALNIPVSTVNYRLDSESFPNYIRLEPKKDVSTRKHSNVKKKVSIEGVIYNSMAEASRALGCSTSKIRGRLCLDDFPDWFTL